MEKEINKETNKNKLFSIHCALKEIFYYLILLLLQLCSLVLLLFSLICLNGVMVIPLFAIIGNELSLVETIQYIFSFLIFGIISLYTSLAISKIIEQVKF
jgi:hypothetical protein